MDVIEGRYPPRDRIWLGVNNVQVLTAANPVDLDGMRERIAELARREPQLRWFTRPGPEPDRYRRALSAAAAEEFAQDLVRPLPTAPGRPGTAAEIAIAVAHEQDAGTPVGIVFAGDGLVGQSFPHVFGDGLSAVIHLRRLLTGPEENSPLPFPIPGLKRPLATALRARYLHDGWRSAPSAVLADLRIERFAPPASVQAGDAVDAAGAPDAAAGAAPVDGGSVEVVIRHLDAAVIAAIKEWRASNAPGASMMSLLTAAIRRGLAKADLIPPEDGMYVAFDLRHTVRPEAVGGNFISVPYLKPADPLDPVAIGASIKAASASGLPLVVLARGAARAALTRRARIPAARRPADRRSVSFSHMRLDRMLPVQLTQGADGRSMVASAATSPNVGSLSFTLADQGNQLTVTAAFCSPFTPRAPIEEILDRLLGDPAALLSS